MNEYFIEVPARISGTYCYPLAAPIGMPMHYAIAQELIEYLREWFTVEEVYHFIAHLEPQRAVRLGIIVWKQLNAS